MTWFVGRLWEIAESFRGEGGVSRKERFGGALLETRGSCSCSCCPVERQNCTMDARSALRFARG